MAAPSFMFLSEQFCDQNSGNTLLIRCNITATCGKFLKEKERINLDEIDIKLEILPQMSGT